MEGSNMTTNAEKEEETNEFDVTFPTTENANKKRATAFQARFISTLSVPKDTPDDLFAHPPMASNSAALGAFAVANETTLPVSTATAAAPRTENTNAAETAGVTRNEGYAHNINSVAQPQLICSLDDAHPILPETELPVEASALEAPPMQTTRLSSGQEINAKNTLQSNSVAVEMTSTMTESAASSFYKQMHGLNGTGNGIAVSGTPVVTGAIQQQQPARRSSTVNASGMHARHTSPPLPTASASATAVSTLSAPIDSLMDTITTAESVSIAVQLMVHAVPTIIVTQRAVLPPRNDTTVFANAYFLEDEENPGCATSPSLPIQSISPEAMTVVTNTNSRASELSNESVAYVGPNTTHSLKQLRSIISLVFTALAVAVVILGTVCSAANCSRRMISSAASTTSDAAQSSTSSDEAKLLSVSDYIQNVTLSGRKIAVLSSRIPKHKLAEELALRWLMYEDSLALQPTNATSRFRLRQRYALLTLFMREPNKEQRNHSVFTASTDECEWFGVTCEKRELTSVEDMINMVTGIVLPFQQLRGTLPPDLGLLSASLMHLNVSNNDLYGLLPEKVDQCTNLETIDLSYNQGFYGSIPRSWGTRWTHLRHFSIVESDLTGLLPAELGHWTLLTQFNLLNNNLTGPIPSVFGENWTKLKHFLVGTSNVQDFSRLYGLTGTIPDTVSRWTNLRSFNVARNSLVGTLPTSLQQWTALEVFDVRENKVLFGTLPAVFGAAWSSLRYADVSSNGFGGSVPESYSQWTRLEHFDVNSNELTGFPSDSWTQWRNLRYLNIKANQFRGEVPHLIGSAWSKLEFIDMGANQLTGSLPESVGKWTSLLSFNANDNDFTGSLPSSIGQWTALTEKFNVARNQLAGTLPNSIGRWSRLNTFTVRANRFTGTIPDAIERWKMVKNIYIDDNNFIGTLPNGICHNDFSLLVADHREGITCSCCTLCNSTRSKNLCTKKKNRFLSRMEEHDTEMRHK